MRRACFHLAARLHGLPVLPSARGVRIWLAQTPIPPPIAWTTASPLGAKLAFQTPPSRNEFNGAALGLPSYSDWTVHSPHCCSDWTDFRFPCLFRSKVVSAWLFCAHSRCGCSILCCLAGASRLSWCHYAVIGSMPFGCCCVLSSWAFLSCALPCRRSPLAVVSCADPIWCSSMRGWSAVIRCPCLSMDAWLHHEPL